MTITDPRTRTVTLDHIEEYCWRQFRCRDPRTVTGMLRLVKLYAAGVISALGEPAAAPEPYAHLQPGDADLTAGVTRCRRCRAVKRNAGSFRADPGRPSGHGDTCRRCAPAAPAPAADPDQVIPCLKCGVPKRAGDGYFRRPDTASGYGKTCRDCIEGKKTCPGCGQRQDTAVFAAGEDECAACTAAQPVFRCRRCGRDKRLRFFPAEKAADTRVSWSCLDCGGLVLPEKEPPRREAYRCRRCGQDKPLDDFPAAKNEHPYLIIPCSACQPVYVPHGRYKAVALYLCRQCGDRKPMEAYPEKKKLYPSLRMKCLDCASVP